jgi:hypothetical protein
MLRLKEGQMLRLTVINELDEPDSLHWHGLVLPFQMDGVPGVSFPASRRAPALPTSSPSFSRHLLVSQPFGPAGDDGLLCPHRHRTRRWAGRHAPSMWCCCPTTAL